MPSNPLYIEPCDARRRADRAHYARNSDRLCEQARAHTANNPGARAGLDRIDSSRGYTDDNVQVVAWLYNSVKQDLTTDEVNRIILEMADGLRK